MKHRDTMITNDFIDNDQSSKTDEPLTTRMDQYLLYLFYNWWDK